MEPTQNEMNFGRQPKPVMITINGEDIDVDFWMRKFIVLAESAGDMTRKFNSRCFKIYPRAVND